MDRRQFLEGLAVLGALGVAEKASGADRAVASLYEREFFFPYRHP